MAFTIPNTATDALSIGCKSNLVVADTAKTAKLKRKKTTYIARIMF